MILKERINCSIFALAEPVDERKLAVIDVDISRLNPEFPKGDSKTRQNPEMPNLYIIIW